MKLPHRFQIFYSIKRYIENNNILTLLVINMITLRVVHYIINIGHW